MTSELIYLGLIENYYIYDEWLPINCMVIYLKAYICYSMYSFNLNIYCNIDYFHVS